MIKKALGLLETYGYIGAIEAADACLKAANVKLIGLELVRGGLVTIKIRGDVSAVKASIDAGAAAAEGVGTVVSIDVIARMGEGLENIIYRPSKGEDTKPEIQNEGTEDTHSKTENETKNHDIEGVEKSRHLILYKDRTINLTDENLLINMKVVDLRRIARNVDGISISKSEIKFAKKRELIEALIGCFNKEVD